MGNNAPPPGDYQSNQQGWNDYMQSNPLARFQAGATPEFRAAQEAYGKQQQTDFNAQHQGGNKKAAPPPPNFNDAATNAAGISRQNVQTQTQANRPNVSTPFGSQQWTMAPDGTWTLKSGLSGSLGGAADSLGSEAARNFSTPMDNGTDARNKAISSAYNDATSRLDPQFAHAGDQLDTKLANQGLDPTSEAARNAQSQFANAKNDAYRGAMFGAIGQGTQAQQATFGENLAARMAPISALQGLQGLTQTPSFMGASLAENPQLLQAAIAQGQYGLQNQQQQNQILGDTLGGIFGLGKSVASFFG